MLALMVVLAASPCDAAQLSRAETLLEKTERWSPETRSHAAAELVANACAKAFPPVLTAQLHRLSSEGPMDPQAVRLQVVETLAAELPERWRAARDELEAGSPVATKSELGSPLAVLVFRALREEGEVGLIRARVLARAIGGLRLEGRPPSKVALAE